MVLKYTLALLVPLLTFSTVYANWSHPQLSFEGATHPSVIQDKDGTFLMTLVRGADIFLTTSRDEGSWSSPIPVITGPPFDSESRLFQDVNGTHWLVFSSNRDGNFDIFLARSRNGSEWSEAVAGAGSPAFDSYPAIMQDSAGRYWIAFISNRDGNYSVHLTSSSDGVTWSEPRRVTEEAQDSFPVMIQDSNGLYWLAFTRLVQWPNKFDIFLTNSLEGLSWSEPRRLASDPSNNNYIDFVQDSRGIYWIAFTSERSGNEDIFITGSRDGVTWSEPVQLSFNMIERGGDFKCDYKSLMEDSEGALRIYYHCVRPVEGIYLVRGTGELAPSKATAYSLESPYGTLALSQLTTSTYPQEKPSWSPDGRYIVYTDRSRDSKGDIWILDTTTGEGKPISQEEAGEDFPSFSPDGRAIVYSSDRGGNLDLWLMDVDGSNKRQLTSGPAMEIFPTWSPDGRRIAYVSNGAGDNDIYTMDADGQNVKRLTSNPAHQNDPAWSPDGRRIAYESNEAGNWDIFVMDADGGNATRLTEEPENQGGPTWSSDGQRIAYESNLGGNFNIWVMAGDGAGKARLTNHTADEYFPAWSPLGDRIAYQSLQGGNGDVWLLELPEPLRSAPLPPLERGLLEGVRLPRTHLSEMGWLLLAFLAALLAVAASRRYLKGPRRRRR